MNKAERKSNIELLRIICILLVIAGHYYTHGRWTEISDKNQYILKICGGGSKLSVNCFVMITGLFGANIRLKRVLAIVRDRWFYSLLTTLALLVFGICTINGKLILRTLFPVLTCRHNYITTFVILYFFIPYINMAIECMGKTSLKKLLLISTMFFSIIPSIYPGFATNTYVYILWMIYLFCMGRYLGMYEPRLPWKMLLLCSIGILLLCLFVVEPRIELYPENYSTAVQYSFPLLVASVSVLEIFRHFEIKHNKFINGLAGATFAVYILHDDPDVRGYIWSEIFHNANYGLKPYLFIHFILTVLLIYFICVGIDKCYKLTIYKLLCKVPTKNVERILDRFCCPR